MADFGDYCCGIDRQLHELLDEARAERERAEAQTGEYQAPQLYHVVQIGEAEKVSEGGATFIAYRLSFGDSEVRRRYSEFESLRMCLTRLYPTFIVPPIPEKHSLAQYAVLQKRAKEDQYIIERRKRMLEHFVNHVAEHPILSSEHVFHRFLEGSVSWTEVLHSPVITGLPRTPLHSSPSRAPGSSVADGASQQQPKIAATNALAADVPVPSALAPIRNVEARWMDCELFTNRYASQFAGVIEKSERRIYRRLGELSGDYAELGATLNGFSLLDHPEALAVAIERAGQAVDSSYIEIGDLLARMEADVGEPIHEYAQYAMIIKHVLRFRMLKNLQLESVEEALGRQRNKLETLMQADDEARRLAHAMEGPSAPREPVPRAGRSPEPEIESLASEATQPQGFATPQRASTDASSVLVGTGRSRGPSVGSTASAGLHGDFAPTLGAPSRVTTRPTHRMSMAVSSDDGDDDDGGIEDDPLLQFQQEESQRWGGGTASTLPRLRGRSRSQLRSSIDRRRDSQASDADGLGGPMAKSEFICRTTTTPADTTQPDMVRSEVIGRSAPDGARAGSPTSALWDAMPNESTASRVQPRPRASSGAASSSPAGAGGAPLGSRLLKSPKVLGDGIMSRLTYALNGMMDVDPEQMRQSQIGRASDKINLLEEQLEMLSNDLTLINTSTQDNLDRFQKQKVREFKGVLISMARMHLEWAEKNLDIWTEAKRAVDEV
ncbi:Sorting nexin, cytoplasm-to-vacuole targeting pathway/endosomal sorting [Coemansia sp. RSA 552]|nr:Sorting nexin, cytoplasm-to-vacuole targeting pathway/endosomal sorting [Coemansia sp. RSA 552]